MAYGIGDGESIEGRLPLMTVERVAPRSGEVDGRVVGSGDARARRRFVDRNRCVTHGSIVQPPVRTRSERVIRVYAGADVAVLHVGGGRRLPRMAYDPA